MQSDWLKGESKFLTDLLPSTSCVPSELNELVFPLAPWGFRGAREGGRGKTAGEHVSLTISRALY